MDNILAAPFAARTASFVNLVALFTTGISSKIVLMTYAIPLTAPFVTPDDTCMVLRLVESRRRSLKKKASNVSVYAV